jgi:hypothetical protein
MDFVGSLVHHLVEFLVRLTTGAVLCGLIVLPVLLILPATRAAIASWLPWRSKGEIVRGDVRAQLAAANAELASLRGELSALRREVAGTRVGGAVPNPGALRSAEVADGESLDSTTGRDGRNIRTG